MYTRARHNGMGYQHFGWQQASKQAMCYVKNTIFETYYQIDRTERVGERGEHISSFMHFYLLFSNHLTHTHTYRKMKAIDSGSSKMKVKRERGRKQRTAAPSHITSSHTHSHSHSHTLQKAPLIYIHKSFSIQTLLHSSFVFSFSVVVGENGDGEGVMEAAMPERAAIFMALCNICIAYIVRPYLFPSSHTVNVYTVYVKCSISFIRLCVLLWSVLSYDCVCAFVCTFDSDFSSFSFVFRSKCCCCCCSVKSIKQTQYRLCDIMHDYTQQELTRLETATAAKVVTMKIKQKEANERPKDRRRASERGRE